ncbi:MAG: hypothetical protein OQK00_08080 [Rhodobacteraceae bacterium]|nr:hypothetical protein [Paracoccaceae bacterium]MCW9041725.1 hypothetical protein [Pseudopelagicola sp.]
MWGWVPSRAKLWAVLTTIALGFLAWFRLDAKRDARAELEEKDLKHAKDIRDAASDARADHDNGVRPYADHGWRD